MSKMTYDEVMNIYGKVEVHFKGGYKHKFTYESNVDDGGDYIEVILGDGDPQTVYRSIPEYAFLEHLGGPLKIYINSEMVYEYE